MAAIIHQMDKRSGITYAYESVSYWNKEKKQFRAKRTLIGRVDQETGKITPTDGHGKKKKEIQSPPPAKKNPVPMEETKRCFYGATYLVDVIGDQLGITDDLKTCFDEQSLS